MKKDLSTKIISLLFAIFLWFYIIQVQNPEIEKTIKSVPVQFTKSELEARGLTLINDKEVQINVKIRGQRKYLSGIKKEDVTVVADVTNIDSKGTHKINTNVILPYGNVEVLEQKPAYITVTVDEIVEVEKDVKVKQVGTPKDGYCVTEYKLSQEKIKIRGPRTIVSTVDRLEVAVDVSGTNNDITATDETVKLIGTSGESFNTPYVSLSHETVDIHCIVSKKKTVAIDLKFADDVPGKELYTFDDSSIKTVEIAGATDAVEKIKSISTKEITYDMFTENGEIEVHLKLPEGVVSQDGEKITVKIVKNNH